MSVMEHQRFENIKQEQKKRFDEEQKQLAKYKFLYSPETLQREYQIPIEKPKTYMNHFIDYTTMMINKVHEIMKTAEEMSTLIDGMEENEETNSIKTLITDKCQDALGMIKFFANGHMEKIRLEGEDGLLRYLYHAEQIFENFKKNPSTLTNDDRNVCNSLSQELENLKSGNTKGLDDIYNAANLLHVLLESRGCQKDYDPCFSIQKIMNVVLEYKRLIKETFIPRYTKCFYKFGLLNNYDSTTLNANAAYILSCFKNIDEQKEVQLVVQANRKPKYQLPRDDNDDKVLQHQNPDQHIQANEPQVSPKQHQTQPINVLKPEDRVKKFTVVHVRKTEEEIQKEVEKLLTEKQKNSYNFQKILRKKRQVKL